MAFTDYYGQQSCTAGRAAFIGGNVPVRTGMTKVGLPGAKEGWQKTDVTMATVLKSLGYATGQFGKNHQGDRDEHLPTMHGFDEFFGNLYHLNAEEEPENEDYPGDMVLANGKTFLETFGPRGVLRCKADGKGGQTIEDTGPLTKKRMETIDEETLAAAKDFITAAGQGGQALLLLVERHPHALPHPRQGGASRHLRPGRVLATAWSSTTCTSASCSSCSTSWGSPTTRSCMYSTDNGPHYNTWPDAGTTPFRSEKNSNWEGAYRVPAFVRWPGQFPAGVTLNGIVSHEDWLPTFAAAAGDPEIKEQACARASSSTAASYRNYIDGYNLLDYLSGKAEESPRTEFFYVNDDGADRGDPLRRLEGGLSGEPGPGLRRLAGAVHRAARAAAVQPPPRSVREGPAQLEHLRRLVPRPALRDRAAAADGRRGS